MDEASFSTASLVFGLLSLILSLILGWLPFIALALGIVGLTMSVRAREIQPGTMKNAAFVLSLLGTVLSGIRMISWISCMAACSPVW